MSNPIVDTKFGKISGVTKVTADGKEFASFQGIPYVEQPIGEFRYRDPRPLKPWEGVLDASKEGPISFNYDLYSVINKPFSGGDECLTLNVYSPNLKPEKPLPVFVWIHGGGFVCGSGTTEYYGPDFIVEQDVLMVSINYRLCAFGFLSFKDPEIGVPGNAGLKDQSMALRWIKENIVHFGGDPENITIAGESAGAASCHYHMISPMSEGLFNRAILMSASALTPWAYRIPGKEGNYEAELAKLLGWNGEGDEKAIYKTILDADAELVAKLSMDQLLTMHEKVFGNALFAPFLPVVEPYESELCFMSKMPLEMGRNAWSKDLDIIIGGLSHEGIMFYDYKNQEFMDALKKDYGLLVPMDVKENLHLSDEKAKEKGEALKKVYFGNDEPSSENEIFLDYLAEKIFWHGIYRATIQRVRDPSAKGKTYSYWMEGDVDPNNNHYVLWRRLCNIPHFKGFNHGDELPLLFKSNYNVKPSATDSSVYNLFKQFLGICTQFTKTGEVNHESIGNVDWKEVSKEEQKEEIDTCLVIKETGAEMGPLPIMEKIRVWNEIYESDDLLF